MLFSTIFDYIYILFYSLPILSMDADNVFNHALPPHEIGYVTFFPEGQASRQKFYTEAKASRLTDGD